MDHRIVPQLELRACDTLPRVGENIGRRWAHKNSDKAHVNLTNPIEKRKMSRRLRPQDIKKFSSRVDASVFEDFAHDVSLSNRTDTAPFNYHEDTLLSQQFQDTDVEDVALLVASDLRLGFFANGDTLVLEDPDFDVLNVNHPRKLRAIVYNLISQSCDMKFMGIQEGALWEYIRDVSKNYRPNPFHNFKHAVSVLHFLYVILKETHVLDVLSDANKFAFLLSALVHDVDHPGTTNLFEINSGSDLALFYNDTSVLENHHCATAFRLLKKPENNIFGRVSVDQKKEMRSSMISLILATDMSKHSEIIESTKDIPCVRLKKFNAAQEVCIGKLFLHSADLSGPAKSFNIAVKWSRLVTAEFNRQVEMENRLGLPILGFMAAGDEKKFLQNEIGFYSFFVAPLWRSVSSIFPELAPISAQLEGNITQLKALVSDLEEIRAVPQSDIVP